MWAEAVPFCPRAPHLWNDCGGRSIHLRCHSSALDDSFEYDNDLKVLVSRREVVGADVPQRTGLVDAVLNDDWPHEEQSTFVVAVLAVISQAQLALVDRQHFTLASHPLTY